MIAIFPLSIPSRVILVVLASGNSDATNVINNDEEEAEHERQPKQKLIVR